MPWDGGGKYIEAMRTAWLQRWSKETPSRCAVCGAWPARPVCEGCVGRFAPPVHRCRLCALPLPEATSTCGACLREPPPLDACHAAVAYAYPWSGLVGRFKFSGEPGWAQSGDKPELRYRAAREELAQANRLGSLGQITAGVAHEINQPVAAIRTFAENGAAFLERSAPDRAAESFERIVGLADRIGAITGELRAFSRRKTPAQRTVPLASVIEGVMLLIGDAAREVVVIDGPFDHAVQVTGDRIRLEQIMVNLIQNALEAVKGVPAPAIRLTVRRDDEAVTIAVQDNGPGIDPAVRDSLFTPFVTGRAGGLGLGLAIARDLAREFGGDLALVESEKGARFEVRLRSGDA